ncbi:hypothetical protein A6C57_02125 [Fibrella sp. ES10-3-2-2]
MVDTNMGSRPHQTLKRVYTRLTLIAGVDVTITLSKKDWLMISSICKVNFLCCLLLIAQVVSGQTNTIDVPFKLVDGYGPFFPSYISPLWQDANQVDEWSKTHYTLKGVPVGWQRTQVGYLRIDPYQHVYQHAMAGNISDSIYNQLQTSWLWTPDTSKLTTQAIRSFVYVATGLDETGKRLVLIDTNNNLDFTDEQPIEPLSRATHSQPLPSNTRPVQYERYLQREVVKATANLSVWLGGDGIMCTFPSYALAFFTTGNRTESIAVVSAGFTDLAFQPSTSINLTDSLAVKQIAFSSTNKIPTRLMSKQGEYITIDKVVYQYTGIDLARQVIQLKKMPSKRCIPPRKIIWLLSLQIPN